MPPPIARSARLRADLDLLADRVSGATFALAGTDQPRRHRLRDEIADVIGSYLVPRLGDPDGPLLIVVAGPTGSGKSTVVNSLAGSAVSRPGALRPTTRQPVVWTHEMYRDRYDTIGGVRALVVAEDHPLLRDVTIVDTPDIDSYVAEHRQIADQVLRRADVVVFLTSAQRYADAVPWEVLGEVDRRGSLVVFVLNRLSRRSAGAASDYAALLRAHGLEPDVIHGIQEQRIRGEEGILPGKSVKKLMDHVMALAMARAETVTRVTERAVSYAISGSRAVAAEIVAQDEQLARLAAVVDGAYDDAMAELVTELDSGGLVRAEVVERWSERVGTGEVARWAKGSASWLKTLADRLGGQPTSVVSEMRREAGRELSRAVGTRLDRAARSIATGWELEPGGRTLLTADLRTTGGDALADAEAAIDRWLAGLTKLVEAEVPGRFRTARVASTGINAAAVGSILALFASTGGITGAEVGVAAGAAAAQQGLLEHILGRAAAQSLAGSARASLIDSMKVVFAAEASRFHAVLGAAGDPTSLAEEIEMAAALVERTAEEFYAR